MEDFLAPTNTAQDHQFSYEPSIAHMPPTAYSTTSQPTCAQSLGRCAPKHAKTTCNLLDTLNLPDDLHPRLPNNTNLLQTMPNKPPKPPHDLLTINESSIQAQVLVPNPLLSDDIPPDRCMFTVEHFLDSNALPSPNLPLNYSPTDESQMKRLILPQEDCKIECNSGSSQFFPVNDSPLGLKSNSILSPSAEQPLLEASSTKIPFASSNYHSPRSDLIHGKKSFLLCNPHDVATQLHYEGAFQQISKSSRSTNVGFGSGDARSSRKIQPQNSFREGLGSTSSGAQLAQMQIPVSQCTSNGVQKHEIGEPGVCSRLLQTWASRGNKSESIDLVASQQDPYLQEIAAFSDQAKVARGATVLAAFDVADQSCKGLQRQTAQLREGSGEREQVLDTDFAIVSSVQDNVNNFEKNSSPAPQKEWLTGRSFQDRLQRDEAYGSTGESFSSLRKRRRLDRFGEELFECQIYQATGDVGDPSYDREGILSEGYEDQKDEGNHQFNERKDSGVLHDYQAHDQSNVEMADEVRVSEQNGSELCSDNTDITKEKQESGWMGPKDISNVSVNDNEQLNEQRKTGDNIFDEQEKNDTAANQKGILNSGAYALSHPSYAVRAVEQKEGCSYMVLEVQKPEVCQSCDKRFPTKELLDLHVGKKHEQSARRRYRKRERQSKEYRCTVCNLQLANDANLRRHCKLVHEGETVETCDLCNANFNSHHGLVLHLRDLHGILPESVQEKEWRNRTKRQYRKKNPPNSVPTRNWVVWKCGNCSFFSENKGNMIRHINIVHLKIADHVCDECSEVFKTKHNLQVHLINRHPKKFEDPMQS